MVPLLFIIMTRQPLEKIFSLLKQNKKFQIRYEILTINYPDTYIKNKNDQSNGIDSRVSELICMSCEKICICPASRTFKTRLSEYFISFRKK